MNKRLVVTTIVLAATFGNVGVIVAAPQQQPQQHQEHHPEATAQEAASDMPAMCQQMMGEMHEHMETCSR